MGFKIGDKVRINTKFPSPSVVGKICTITRVLNTYFTYDYDITDRKDKCWICPVYEREIEPCVRKGEQLLLFEL